MFKTNGGEGGDGQPDANKLASQVLSGVSHPRGNAHQPVGHDALDKHGAPAVVDLVLRDVDEVLVLVVEDLGRIQQAHHDGTTSKVTTPRQHQQPQRVERSDLALPPRCSCVRADACVELPTAYDDGRETKWETNRSKDEFEHAQVDLIAVGVARCLVQQPTNLQAGGVAKADVAAGYDGEEEELVGGPLGLLLTMMSALSIDLRGAQDVALLHCNGLESS
mmetsp:Transcript_8744/g.18648  ORF Transcript_8744/g.18648 Transcript_8744/m.18648 type:complete len:221 (-) Transcript_8744:643-1305(-)